MKAKIIGCVVILAAFFMATHGDYEDAKIQHADKCYMVNLWIDERDAGVHPFERSGWPPASEDERRGCAE